MPYKRKSYNYKSKRASRFAKKSGLSRKKWSANRRSLVKTIKRVVLKAAEPKMKHSSIAKAELYHNAPVLLPLNALANQPAQGTRDDQRIGDRINLTGFKLRLMFGQKDNRPNVTFRWWILDAPKGTTYTASAWFDRTTNNYLLDDVNSDMIKTVKTGVIRPNQASLLSAGALEYTFSRKITCSRKRLVKFQTDAATENSDTDLWFLVVAYDAYGSLVTDNIAYVQGCSTMFYKDP
jgi:hypothetical protein